MQPKNQTANAQPKPFISPEYKAIIQKCWDNNKNQLADEMKAKLDCDNIYILYDVEIITNNLLKYAAIMGELDLLDDLSQLYLLAYPYLKKEADGGLKWIFADSSISELCYLLNKEIPLITSQFLFAVAHAIDAIAQLDEAKRTADMKLLARQYTPAIADFFDRWYSNFLDKIDVAIGMPFPPLDDCFTFDLPISDDLLFLFGGMAYLLSAGAHAPMLAELSAAQCERYRLFIGKGSALLQKRLTPSALQDFEGNALKGLNLDLGVWDGYEDYTYSGYDSECYPCECDQRITQDVGWDISHARRFVDAFDALYENRAVTGLPFPDDTVMKSLANQLVYGTFSRDFARPRFTNFMDGTNGWYRVGYAGRENFGYAPYALTDAVPTGGYGFWSRHNADISRVMDGIFAMLKEGQVPDICGEGGKPDCELARFIVTYYGDFNKPNSLAMLMFLPSLVEVARH
jgi:hypothetical protein